MSEEHFSSYGNSNHYQPTKPYFNPKPPVSSVQHIARNTNITPLVTSGDSIIKAPVVLAESRVQIDLDSKIEFPEPVLEIKKVKKNLKVTQCRLLLPTNKLFIKGFVRKNIQYAAPKHGDKHGITSLIKSFTVDIPFNVVTEVNFIKQPQFQAAPPTQQFSYFNTEPLPSGFSSKEELLSADFTEYNQISEEVFNELPFCELLSSKFIEYDEVLNREMGEVWNSHDQKVDAPFEEGTFTKIEEKMVIELSLKVLQKQQVKVSDHRQKHNDNDVWEE